MICYFYSTIFILGTLIGSFINCLVWRLHKNESILGRSYCPKCRKQIYWYENIPILSYIFLKAKCSGCGKKISIQYPLVELITGILFALSFYLNLVNLGAIDLYGIVFSFDFEFLIRVIRDLFFISVMIIIFLYDLRWYLILDRITLPAIFLIFALNIFLGFDLKSLLLGVLVGGGFFLFQFLVSRGKWIGGGDIRLGALMGAMFSWPMILLALFLSYIIGSLVSVPLVIFGKKEWGSQIPFGVFLTSASVVVVFWGTEILRWYLSLIY